MIIILNIEMKPLELFNKVSWSWYSDSALSYGTLSTLPREFVQCVSVCKSSPVSHRAAVKDSHCLETGNWTSEHLSNVQRSPAAIVHTAASTNVTLVSSNTASGK